jgi:hypothetical protein
VRSDDNHFSAPVDNHHYKAASLGSADSWLAPSSGAMGPPVWSRHAGSTEDVSLQAGPALGQPAGPATAAVVGAMHYGSGFKRARLSWQHVVAEAWESALTLFMLYIVTLSIFPGVFAEDLKVRCLPVTLHTIQWQKIKNLIALLNSFCRVQLVQGATGDRDRCGVHCFRVCPSC